MGLPLWLSGAGVGVLTLGWLPGCTLVPLPVEMVGTLGLDGTCAWAKVIAVAIRTVNKTKRFIFLFS
jgi:hypothetical protein